MTGKNGPYYDPYARLAYAIIQDAKKHNDTVFLKSVFCDDLRLMCQLDDELHSATTIRTSIARATNTGGFHEDQ